jgi:hypothetical protein
MNNKNKGLTFTRAERSIEPKLISLTLLKSLLNKVNGELFKIQGLLVISADPGSYTREYIVELGKGTGIFEFCASVIFQDDEGESLTLPLWKPFEKVIGMTAAEFKKLSVEQQEQEFRSIDDDARYDIVVKSTSDGFKLKALEKGAAQDKDDESTPKQKRAKFPEEGSQEAAQGAAQDEDD